MFAHTFQTSFLLFSIFKLVYADLGDRKNPVCLTNCYSVVKKILLKIEKDNLAGQILASSSWFHFTIPGNDGDKDYFRFSHAHNIPWLVYGSIGPQTVSNHSSTKPVPIKFTTSNFIHLEHSLELQSVETKWSTFSKMGLYMPFKFGFLRYQRNGRSGIGIPVKFVETDISITVFRSMESDSNYFKSLVTRRKSSNNMLRVWIGCSGKMDALYNQSIFLKKFFDGETHKSNLPVPRLYSSRRSFRFLQSVDKCYEGIMHFKKYANLAINRSHNGNALIRRSCLYCLNNSTDLPSSDIINSGSRRIIVSPFHKNGFLYSSLVFIAKRENNNSTNVWGPFSVTSWIGILIAYTVTAIVFGVIKIVTMNNLNNSWYDCIINQLMSLMNEESKVDKGKIATTAENRVAVDLSDEIGRSYVIDKITEKRRVSCRRISVKSVAGTNQEFNVETSSILSEFFILHESPPNRGKMSKAILYGMIRVVSFILLAMYEGKLYNTITFPKSKLLASFDDLISNGNYAIKISNEAAKYENISTKIKGSTLSGYAGGMVLTSENRSTKVVESVNILDCVNWVEAGPDPNHACVGYEFELRNLHKAQKSDKVLVKSKYKMLRLGSSASARLSRRRGFTMFPGGFQISKWILESGILQLWSIVENTFMESLINPNWSDPFKVFTIRDYLGLFVIYSVLLILSSIMFFLEHSVFLGRRILRHERFKAVWKYIKNFCSRLLESVVQLFTLLFCDTFSLAKMKYVKWQRTKQFRNSSSPNHFTV